MTLDRVFSCPNCGAAVIRTNVERLDARGLRCPNRRCNHAILLPVDPQVGGEARRYVCRGVSKAGQRCGQVLFVSRTPAGRVWMHCPSCQHLQSTLIGDAPARMIVGQVAVHVGER
jgi:hypothetical protein